MLSSTTVACASSASQRPTAPRSSHRLAPRLHTAGLQQHGRQRRRAGLRVAASAEEELDQQLQADLERLRQRQAATGAPPSAPAQQATAQQPAAASGGGPLEAVKDAVDKILIADFFFVLLALGWLGAGLAERSALQSTTLLDTWLSLWQWVFQPAIGVLMLGALVSGAVGWVKDNLGSQR